VGVDFGLIGGKRLIFLSFEEREKSYEPQKDLKH